MTALATDSLTKRVRAGGDIRNLTGGTLSAAATAVIYSGALIAKGGTGNAFVTKATATGGQVIGYNAGDKIDNSAGADGAIELKDGQCECGRARLVNSAASITNAHIGSLCYVVDDQTVAATGSVPAGVVMEVGSDGFVYVWVDAGATAFAQAFGVQTNNQVAPFPVQVFTFAVPDAATGDIDIVVARKVEVIDATAQKQNGAGAGNTMQLKNGATAITDAMACAVDNTITRAGTIDDAQSTINAGGTLRLTATRAAGTRNALVTVFALPRA